MHIVLVGVSDILYFFLVGEGAGGVRGAGEVGGVAFLSKIPGGGGVSRRGRGRGAGVCRELGNWRGGRVNIFFGAEMPIKLSM